VTPPKTAERAYTLAEAAELKSVSIGFLRKAIKATSGATLPAKVVGKSYRIAASDLEAFWAGLEDA
jgi:excisionase family DNA binding protein